MNFTRTDANALLAIALGSALGMATLGPQAWLTNALTTTTTTTYTTYSTERALASDAPDLLDEAVTVIGSGVTQGEGHMMVRVRTDESVTIDPTDPSGLQPIIYVDGIRIEGELSDLDPDEIERIEVIKGDAALERFGPEAASGVVQIFLKASVSPDPGD